MNNYEISSGKLIINEFGNGFVNLSKRNITIYIPKKNIHFAYHNQNVDVKYYMHNNMYYGEIINFSLIDKLFIGKVSHFYKNHIYIKTFQLKNILIAIQTDIQLQKNDWIQCKITNVDFENNQIYGIFLDKLGDSNIDIDVLIEHIFNLKDLDKDFDYTNPNIDESYIDLTHLDTFTIDPENSLDCDDAFSIEPHNNFFNIYVHISDVSLYINPTIPYFDDIIFRGNTFYGKNKNWPMIPSILSNNICSILPNKITYVITHLFQYYPDTNKLVFIKWFPSYVNSKNKYDYQYADINISNFPFSILYNSSLIIKNNILDFDVNNDSKSHFMIKYWMIQLNIINANYINKIYRLNPIPSKHKFEILHDYTFHLYGKYIDCCDRMNIINIINTYPTQLTHHIIKSLLTKAYYDVNNVNNVNNVNTEQITHYGLGLCNYTHYTSPIRRACDLLNHCLIKGYIIDVSKYIDIINAQELLQDNIELFISEFNILNNIKINNVYQSIIMYLSQTYIIVFIPSLDNKYTIHISNLSKNKLIFNSDNKTLNDLNNNIIFSLFQTIDVYISKITHSDIHFSLHR
jgi:exoribonuclease R